MAVRNYSNITNVGTLSGAVGTGETTLAINGGWSNLPSFPFYVIVDRGNALEECMLATGGNATALTVTRGYDGSPASSHGIGASIEHAVLAEFFNKADQHVEASTNVHGLAGGAAVVGTTSTQTLTNKTLNSSIVNLAHSTSPAASQAVQVSADAATARDGFVWNKSAAATGAAFKAISSGATKFTVDADGKVVLNSTTGTDKALAIQQSAAERFSILNDGTVDAGLQDVGASGDRFTIRNRPTQTAFRIRDAAAASVFSVGSAGNVDASGYIASAGAVSSGSTLTAGTDLTVNGTAAVTGTSTLTGDVTLPLPASGVTSRFTVNSRTGGTNITGKRQDGTSTFLVQADGEVQALGKAFIHDGAAPVLAKVNATGNVPSPSTNMVIFDNSDGKFKKYNGTTWDTILGTSTHLSNPTGFLSGQQRGSNSSAIAATETQFISTNSVSLLASSLYRIDLSIRFFISATNDVFIVRLRDTNTSGTIRMEFNTDPFKTASTPYNMNLALFYKTTSAEASRSFIGSAIRSSGTGTFTAETSTAMTITYLGASSLLSTI